jgi:hypothetical protein
MTRPNRRPRLALAALILASVPGDALADRNRSIALAAGRRAISVAVEVGGGPSLAAAGADNGDPPPWAVWQRLTDLELKPVDGSPAVAPDPADPLRATLRGDIEVRVNQDRVRVGELRLARRSEESGWTVDPADVGVMAGRAGHEPAPARPPSAPAGGPAGRLGELGRKPWVVRAAAAVVLAGVVIVAVARRRRR